jgi:hypothetical protein
MAKKKKRRQRQRPADGGGPPAVSRGADAGTSAARRARKEEARQAREQERKRARRAAALRRSTRVGVATVVVVAGFALVTRLGGANDIPPEAVETATNAGCTEVTRPVPSPSGGHLTSGQSFAYQQRPATSGRHDPSPLPELPHVYTGVEQYSETRAVHALEHAAVMLYYRSEGAGALPQPVIERLARVANGSRYTILAPHANLPDDSSFALAAWNQLQTCPASIQPEAAATVALGFIEAFECTGNAPENGASGAC